MRDLLIGCVCVFECSLPSISSGLFIALKLSSIYWKTVDWQREREIWTLVWMSSWITYWSRTKRRADCLFRQIIRLIKRGSVKDFDRKVMMANFTRWDILAQWKTKHLDCSCDTSTAAQLLVAKQSQCSCEVHSYTIRYSAPTGSTMWWQH